MNYHYFDEFTGSLPTNLPAIWLVRDLFRPEAPPRFLLGHQRARGGMTPRCGEAVRAGYASRRVECADSSGTLYMNVMPKIDYHRVAEASVPAVCEFCGQRVDKRDPGSIVVHSRTMAGKCVVRLGY